MTFILKAAIFNKTEIFQMKIHWFFIHSMHFLANFFPKIKWKKRVVLNGKRSAHNLHKFGKFEQFFIKSYQTTNTLVFAYYCFARLFILFVCRILRLLWFEWHSMHLCMFAEQLVVSLRPIRIYQISWSQMEAFNGAVSQGCVLKSTFLLLLNCRWCTLTLDEINKLKVKNS